MTRERGGGPIEFGPSPFFLLMFEHYHQPLISRSQFLLRVLRNSAVAGVLVLVSLLVGALGYHTLGGLRWVDAIENASMILTGMGPVDALHNDPAKLFASAYALFSGVVFLSVVGVLFAPVVHRFLHNLHMDLDEEESDGSQSGTHSGSHRSRAP